MLYVATTTEQQPTREVVAVLFEMTTVSPIIALTVDLKQAIPRVEFFQESLGVC